MAESPIDALVRLLGRLPGIGERSATRLAFHVLGGDPEYAGALGQALSEIHTRVRRCTRCGNFGADEICAICQDERRNPRVLCVVARVQDLLAIERSASFRGRFFVLHGLLAPLDGIGPDDLPVPSLMTRIEEDGVEEVILATPLHVEGEATAHYLAGLLTERGVAVTRIASGIPHGGELEFADQVTLGHALDRRTRVGGER